MTPIQISLSKVTITPGQELDLPAARRALWLQSGIVTINDNLMKADGGRYTYDGCTIFNGGSQQAVLLSFEIRIVTTPLPANQGHELLLSETTTVADGKQIVRLDKVTFPAGSRAYRHIHPGPGIRYLTKKKFGHSERSCGATDAPQWRLV